MSKFYFASAFLILLLNSCLTSQNIPTATIDYEETILDTLTVTAPRKSQEVFTIDKYNQEATKTYDLIHMVLSVEPSWETETVKGNATLFISPYFYPLDKIELDAVQMDIHSVKLFNSPCTFEYDGRKLIVNLGQEFNRTQEFNLIIDYTAKPTLGHIPNARYRSNDQGLYFIEPNNDYPNKPYQIWTQGETEYNSCWFPTRDKPNERYTHSIFITVNDTLKTLSNGLLVESKKLPDNKRQDHWIMEKEHAPYLTMIAIGDYSITQDKWKNVPLQYYVYPEYEAYAKNIFNHTPEMLSYFSELTGVMYPWPKYAQIIVEDFVAGAMENTTAVTFGDFVQKTDEELIDNHNDDIVAHEMFHHWFGDYVTCESWANLTLNEGFANYSEYLWIDHKYGKDEAHNKRMAEWSQYILQTRSRGVHPLIDYGYDNKELMFDAHSYNKGGLTLHYLRHLIGDEAFFAGMNQYLVDNANTTVEIDELRLAYEKVTGIDLNPFFDQWFLDAGHPDMEIYYSRNDTFKITVKQIQNPATSRPIFEMPLEWNIYLNDGTVLNKKFYTKDRETNFLVLGLNPKDIKWINFDPHHVFIGEYLENRDSLQYMIEYKEGDQYDKREALDILRNFVVSTNFYEEILRSETHYINKLIALYRINFTEQNSSLLKSSIRNSNHVSLTKALLKEYLKNPDLIDISTLKYLMENQQSMSIITPIMQLLYEHSREDFELFLATQQEKHNPNFISEISSTISNNYDINYTEFLWEESTYLDKTDFTYAIHDHLELLKSEDEIIKESIIKEMAVFLKRNQIDNWRKKVVIDRYDFLYRNTQEAKKKDTLDKLIEKYDLKTIIE